MPLFFIEMGQGIIARGDLRVCTSPLYSCTLFAGYNRGSGYGGAFHYPSNGIGMFDVRADLDLWATLLRPSDVTLVFADCSGHGVMGTGSADKDYLQMWVRQKCGVSPITATATGAGMELLADGGFSAGRRLNLAGDFSPGSEIHLETRSSGTYVDYGRFTLIGQNRS